MNNEVKVHQAGFSSSPGIYQAPCRLHSWNAFVHEAPWTKILNSLSCCAPNFDLSVHRSIWCVPSHHALICLLMAPFISLSGHRFCQSRPAITLHLDQWETPVSCLTNPLLAGLALVWDPPSLHGCLLCLFSLPQVLCPQESIYIPKENNVVMCDT